MSVLTCPTCGSNSCPIFYGFNLILPNFDNPKNLNIELKYICSSNDNKMLSFDLEQYIKMIELNSKFYNNIIQDGEDINNLINNTININGIKEEIQKIDFGNIINIYNNIISLNEQQINSYININKFSSVKIIFFLKRYIELNNQLLFFIKIFLKNISKYKNNNLLISFYYIYKLLEYNNSEDKKNLCITQNLIEEYIQTNDISKLPFIIKLKIYVPKSKDFELLTGHTLPIVGLSQMRSGLLLSGSCGLLKVWEKNNNFNDEDYNKYKIIRTVLYQLHLIRCFIELEDDIVIFCKGNQLVEALINNKDPYKEIFVYQNVGSSIESLAALNQNKNFAAGFYQKLYIFERNNKSPILTLQYHRLFIMKMISLPKLNLFCSSGSDNKIIVYNSKNFELFNQFEFEESHIVCLCNYNHTDFCASTMGGKIWYFKWEEKNNIFERIGPIDAHLREIYGIRQIKNGQVVSVSRDMTIKFWDIQKRICVLKIILDKKTGSYDHICQLDDGRLCFASCNKTIKIFNNLPYSNVKYPFS